MPRALIVGDQTDTHVIAVLEAIAARGGSSPFVLDAPRLAAESYLLGDDSLTISDDAITLADRGPGWLRRYAPTRWGAGSLAGSLEAVSKRAFLTLVGSISRLGNRQWLTDLDTMLRAEDRLVQLAVAAELAMRIPQTVVTSDGERARSVLGDRFIVKPIASGYYDTPAGPMAVFTTALTANDLEQVEFADAPFVAQEEIEIREHLRVVTVGQSAWVASLDAAGRPLDWRRQEEAHFSWKAVCAPEVNANALAIAERLGVGFSSQDWVRDNDDRPVFLDLNPGGQWLFLPEEVAAPITDAIAEFLCRS